jgi:hypothetical protein
MKDLQVTIRNEKNEVCFNLWLNDDFQCGDSVFQVISDFYKEKQSYLILLGATEIHTEESHTYIFSKEFLSNKFIQMYE